MEAKPACIAITGGGGFLGNPTVAALSQSDSIIVAASRTSGKRNGSMENFFPVRVDITDRSSWKNLFIGNSPTRLIHLAWDYLDAFEDPRHYLELLPAHLAFIEWCVRNGISDVTIAGTCYEYGLVDGELFEEMPAKPVLAYAIAKDALRRSLEHFSRSAPFALKWARIFFVRGDGEAEKGIFKRIRDAGDNGESTIPFSWGEQLRDYLPRREVGRFLAHVCLQNDVVGIVNCCSGRPVSMRRMVEDYAKQWPKLKLDFGKTAYRSFEPMAFWGNRARMDEILSVRIPAAMA